MEKHVEHFYEWLTIRMMDYLTIASMVVTDTAAGGSIEDITEANDIVFGDHSAAVSLGKHSGYVDAAYEYPFDGGFGKIGVNAERYAYSLHVRPKNSKKSVEESKEKFDMNVRRYQALCGAWDIDDINTFAFARELEETENMHPRSAFELINGDSDLIFDDCVNSGDREISVHFDAPLAYRV